MSIGGEARGGATITVTVRYYNMLRLHAGLESERLELPEFQGSEDQRRTSLTVNVDREGAIVVSGRTITKGELLGFVSDELAAVGDNPDRLTVVLRGDQRGNSRTINEIVSSLSRLQIKKVRVAVQVPE